MQKLKIKSQFVSRLTVNIMVGLISVAIMLYIGMCGYHKFEGMSWVDAFANASMILSGMGPLQSLKTSAGKIFAGFYALFSGLAFIAIIALIFAPVVHRFFIKIHLEGKSLTNENELK